MELVEVSASLVTNKVPNDSLAGFDPFNYTWNQWGIGKTQLDKAWDKTTGDSSIVVACMDSGVDWIHEDFEQGTGTSGTFWVNSSEDAWADPNDPTTGNGIDDDGNGFVDDWRGWNFYQNNNNIDDSEYPLDHGTGVTSVIAARTHNTKGIAGVAGGWGVQDGVKLMALKVYHQTTTSAPNDSLTSAGYDDAILYAAQNGARIIQSSTWPHLNRTQIEDAIKVIHDGYNSLFIISSGNDSVNTKPIGWLGSLPDVFSVATSNQNDRSYKTRTGPNLDITAPGDQIDVLREGDRYDRVLGSSQAAPFVAGVAGLMLSINPCLDNEEIANILRHRADKVNSLTPYLYYNNPDKPGHSNLMGYGRVNAMRAVNAADAMGSASLDLYVKDHYSDFGYPQSYPDSIRFDDWSDIWVRNQPDGHIFREMESIEYDSMQPAWVYVRVRNKSCVNSTGNEQLRLYWTKSSTNSSWPQNWDGSQPNVGGLIGNIAIPRLEAGEDTILEFQWTILPSNASAWGVCLMARIESIDDPIVSDTNLSKEIRQNNNIAARNLYVVNADPGTPGPVVNGVEYPYGIFVLMGNGEDGPTGPIDIYLDDPFGYSGTSVTEDAEVKLICSDEFWQVFEASELSAHESVEIVGDKEILITSGKASLRNLQFAPSQRCSVFVGFNFLTEEVGEIYQYRFHLTQKRGENIEGAMSFNINREDRELFQADAGPDQFIYQGESAQLSASDINEPASYYWYDSGDSLVYTGKSPALSPAISEKYKLEVIADADLYKDYDEVEIKVNPYSITAISPNPATSNLTINYDADEANSAYLIVQPMAGGGGNNYILNTVQNQMTTDVSSYLPGVYAVLLVCDGVVVDSKMLTIQ